MPSARRTGAISWVMMPSPTKPKVLPRSSTPGMCFQSPPLRAACIGARFLVSASVSAIANSATEIVGAVGVLLTTTPRLVAASRSMLSVPVPITVRNLRSGSAAKTSSVNFE